jgi:tRNA G10  N-methylase Trm11
MGQKLLVILLLSLQEDIEIKEFEWYLRDHLFRQSNQDRQQQFKKESLAQEMTSLYLRYRNSTTTSEYMNEMINVVVENLISRQVLKKFENSLELTSRLSRLQCSKCFYISYLSGNEPRNCLRCSFNELHDFPKKKEK